MGYAQTSTKSRSNDILKGAAAKCTRRMADISLNNFKFESANAKAAKAAKVENSAVGLHNHSEDLKASHCEPWSTDAMWEWRTL